MRGMLVAVFLAGVVLAAPFGAGAPATAEVLRIVVVASNLVGDILSDLGPAIAGSIGIAPGGNINPEKEFPSMFEPVHGSAPDIAGKGVANPIAQIWTGAMMLEHLGHADAADAVVRAIERVVADGKVVTRDLGGTAGTKEVGEAVASLI